MRLLEYANILFFLGIRSHDHRGTISGTILRHPSALTNILVSIFVGLGIF